MVSPFLSSDRGQSETAGVILLTAIVVTLAAVVGGAILLTITSDPDSNNVLGSFDSDLTSDTTEVRYTNGETLIRTQLAMVLQNGSQQLGISVANDTALQTADFANADEFRPSDTFSIAHNLVGNVELLLIDTSRETVLYSVGSRIETPSPSVPTPPPTGTTTDTTTSTATSTTTDTPTDTPIETPTDTPTDSPPSVTIDSATHTNKRDSTTVDVSFSVTDPDSNLKNATIVVYDSDGGTRLDSTTVSLSGGSASESVEFSRVGGEKPYYVVVTVRDGAGNSRSASQTTSQQTGPPNSVERIDNRISLLSNIRSAERLGNYISELAIRRAEIVPVPSVR